MNIEIKKKNIIISSWAKKLQMRGKKKHISYLIESDYIGIQITSMDIVMDKYYIIGQFHRHGYSDILSVPPLTPQL